MKSPREQISDGDQDVKIVNASGHRDQLKRQYGLLSVIGVALTVDNAWVALGGSLTVAIYNGGPPGILWELLVACAYYALIGLCVAEFTSSVPSAGGVYHWASIAAGKKWGRVLGYYTGWLNAFGWVFATASIAYISSNVPVQMYLVFNPGLAVEPWHIFVTFVIIMWSCCFFAIFCNRLIPYLQQAGIVLIVVGGLVTIIVVVAMPEQHASNSFVWTDWVNQTGWPSGVAFLTGVLNGAFTIGTVDAVTHMAEELPNPRYDMPKAVFAQVGLGTLTSFCYAIAIFYAISDLDAVLESNGSFPLAVVYHQATSSAGGTFGLLMIVLLSIIICVISTLLAASRIVWALARDDAIPFSGFFSQVSEGLSCPVPATVLCATLSTGFVAITFGSSTAFIDMVGSFVILTSVSCALVIAPNLLTGRRNMPPGPGFYMKGTLGYVVHAATLVLIIFFDTMFCFPYALPATVEGMNYNSVIVVGIALVAALWWIVYAGKNYPGPKLSDMYVGGEIVDGLQLLDADEGDLKQRVKNMDDKEKS